MHQIKGLFITGTDTNVGKTVVAAALIHRYRKSMRLRYWKPIQTGIEQDDDSATVRALAECTDEEILDEGVRLTRPLSPHLAAKLSGHKIEIEALLGTLSAHADPKVSWIIEGAGGALVPINDRKQVADLAQALALPVLVVANTRLGTINHTLLTLEALRRRALVIAGVVLVGEKDEHNRAAIELHGAISVLGEMPTFANLDSKSLGKWARAGLDRDGWLRAQLELAHSPRVKAAS
jgi:dethiobiotin synthase